MIKSDGNSSEEAKRPSARSGKCWHNEPGAQTIRLVTEDNGKFVFPYFHLVSGHLVDTDDGKELLTLRFPSYKVEILGKRLEPLLKALDDLSLAWVRVLPSRHAALAPADSGLVTEIVVRSLEEKEEDK